MNYPPNAPPPGGYGGPPPGGYGPPPGGPGGPGGYGPPPPGGFGPPPGMPGMGPGMGAPMAPYGVDPMTGLPYSDKSKMVAGLLQIFLPFGIGRFYTGHTGLGVAQLLLSLLTCGALSLWPFIDGILILMGKVTDAQGRPLRD